jgi:hypothetical protein
MTALLIAVAVVAGLPARARALPIVDFGAVAPTPGTIAYAGGAQPLVGTGIQVDNVVGLDTPLNADLVIDLLGGVLAFTTGALVSTDATGWTFAGGGSLTLTGVLDLDGNGVLDPGEPTGTLLSGVFSGSPKVVAAAGSFRIVTAGFDAELAPEVAALYGVDGAGAVGGLNLSFSTTRRPPASFASTQVLSGDVTAETAVASVPENGTLLLVGVGMVALGLATRRQLAAAPARRQRSVGGASARPGRDGRAG